MLLKTLGYDVVAIGDDNASVTDKTVIETAQKEQRLIITFDRDYGELIYKHDYKPDQAVLYLRLSEYSPETPGQIVHQLLSEFKLETCRLTVYDGATVRQRQY